jgi:hypothetical protein
LGWEPRVTFSQITGEGRWKKKKVKRPTYPNFLGYVTLITHIFFIWPMLLVKYAWINYIIIIYFIIIIYDVQVLIQMLCKLM